MNLYDFGHMHPVLAAKLVTSDVVIWPVEGKEVVTYYSDGLVKTEALYSDVAATRLTLTVDYVYNASGQANTEMWTAYQPDGATVAVMVTYTYGYNTDGTIASITVS